jgi:hypothetical protein
VSPHGGSATHLTMPLSRAMSAPLASRTFDGDRRRLRHRLIGAGHEIADYEVSPDTCWWLKRNAQRTSSAYWWQRYESCVWHRVE